MPYKVGSQRPEAKINEEVAYEIKRLLCGGLSPTEIARRVGTTRAIVAMIRAEKSWKHVPWPDDLGEEVESMEGTCWVTGCGRPTAGMDSAEGRCERHTQYVVEQRNDAMKREWVEGAPLGVLAQKYGVSKQHVWAICTDYHQRHREQYAHRRKGARGRNLNQQ